MSNHLGITHLVVHPIILVINRFPNFLVLRVQIEFSKRLIDFLVESSVHESNDFRRFVVDDRFILLVPNDRYSESLIVIGVGLYSIIASPSVLVL